MHRLPRHNIIRVFEGFAGYGGATFGLRRAGVRHRVVAYSEVDEDTSVELDVSIIDSTKKEWTKATRYDALYSVINELKS